MPEMTWPIAPPATVNEFSNLVADYLEAYGHYQGGEYSDPLDKRAFDCKAGCVRHTESVVALHYGFRAEGVREEWNRKLLWITNPLGVTWWSDTTPTPEVIATLRSLS